MAFDKGLVQRVADLLLAMGERAVRQRGVFGGRGFLRGKSTFLIVWGEGLIVKASRADYAGALARPGVAPFTPGSEKPMSTWLVVDAEQVAEDPELRDWIALALRSLGA